MTEKVEMAEKDVVSGHDWDPGVVAEEIGALLLDRGGVDGYLHRDESEIGVGARYEAALAYFRGAMSLASRERPPRQAPALVAAHLPPAALGVLIAGAYLREGDALFPHEASYGTPLEAMERMGAAALAVALRPPPEEATASKAATSPEAHRTPMHRLAERAVRGLLSSSKTPLDEGSVGPAIRLALKPLPTWEMLRLLYCESRSTVFLMDEGALVRALTETLTEVGERYGTPYFVLEQGSAIPLPCPLCAAEPLPVAGPHGPEHLYPCATMRCSSARCGYSVTVEGLDTPKGREAVLQQAVRAWNRRPARTEEHPPYASGAAGRFLVCPCCGHPDLAPDLRFSHSYVHEGRPVVSGFGPEGSVLLPVQTLRCVGSCPACVRQVCSEENTVQHLFDTWNSRAGARYWPGFAPVVSPVQQLIAAQAKAEAKEEAPPPDEEEDDQYVECGECDGAGELDCSTCFGRGGCPNCGDTGTVVCHPCDGRGKVYAHDTSFRPA